ncbi:MAG: class II fructose-bisphosphate aldolase [Candidatus Adiutrix sp.]|jgi:hypothetical protein|nr:class II fructose-bisphosphate aldolase [Candidatus Adiutrix sp.]
MAWAQTSPEYARLLETGRPPNIKKLFPNSKALIVSGKIIDRALLAKGRSMTISANARNHLIIEGVLAAAQRADAAVIIETSQSEGAYCAPNYWNLARRVDALLNERGYTIPVAVHAGRYTLGNEADLAAARAEVPSIFEAGLTSIALDASPRAGAENLLTTLAVTPLIPRWAGLECTVDASVGDGGRGALEEALFLVQGLNAHGCHPDWIALNNDLDLDLIAGLHQALRPYGLSGAQPEAGGHSPDRLRQMAEGTATTKAGVATALQLAAWGVKVNDRGQAELEAGRLVKRPGRGLGEELWAALEAESRAGNLKAGDLKRLNLAYENRILAQPAEVRTRMAREVEDFAHRLLTEVFFAQGSARLAYEVILKAGGPDPGPKAGRTEDPAQWTREKIIRRAAGDS